MKGVLVSVDPIGDREEWLAERRTGIGGSDVAAVLGLSPWATPWQVYVDKVGAVPPDDGANEAMRLGQLLEPIILDLFTERTGMVLTERQLMVRHPDHEWAFATLDALASPESGVEAKRSTRWSWDDGIPLQYRAQAQWGMLCTGLDVWHFAVLHPASFATYTLEADYDDQAALLRIAEKFWRNHVEAAVPPPVEAGDNAALAAVWPDATGDSVEVDGALVAELVELKAEQKVLAARRDTLEATLKAKLGEASIGTVDGEKAISWPNQSDKRLFDADSFTADNPFMVSRFTRTETVTYLDSKAIKEEEPDLFKKYDRPIRKFYTHKLKEQK